eukprot:327194_1
MALQIINTLIKQIEKNCESKTDENDESKHFIFHITGYGKFANIMDNPSKRVIDNLIKNDFLQNAIDSDIVTIGSLHVMTASGRQGKDELLKLREKNEKIKQEIQKRFPIKNIVTIYLHYGIYEERPHFCLERTAYNEASYLAPDELGWQPQKERIIKEDGDLNHKKYTKLPIIELVSSLKKEYKVKLSDDPARFMCNWIFYWSLTWCKQNEHAMFVHVPSYENISESIQADFAKDLVLKIVQFLSK